MHNLAKRKITAGAMILMGVAFIGGTINATTFSKEEEPTVVTSPSSPSTAQQDKKVEDLKLVEIYTDALAMPFLWEEEKVPFWKAEPKFCSNDNLPEESDDDEDLSDESDDDEDLSDESDDDEDLSDESDDDEELSDESDNGEDLSDESDDDEELSDESDNGEDLSDEFDDGYTYCSLSDIDESSSTESRIMAIMSYLVSEGFTPEAAAAVCGNVAVESGYDPYAYGGNPYYGICQWNYLEEGGYWWQDISDYMIRNGYDTMSFEGQVKAIVHAYHGQLEEDFESFKNCSNVEEATEVFTVWYEACPGGETCTEYVLPGSPYQGLATRKSEAWQAYYLYTGQQSEYTGEKPYVG